MREICTAIQIRGRAEKVWNALVGTGDLNWNPFIKKIDGRLEEGSTIGITLKGPGERPMQFSPRILKFEPFREFRWLGHLFIRGLFDGEHYFVIHDRGPDGIYFEHGERFSGVFSGLIFKLIGRETRESFIKMNKALKRYIENESV